MLSGGFIIWLLCPQLGEADLCCYLPQRNTVTSSVSSQYCIRRRTWCYRVRHWWRRVLLRRMVVWQLKSSRKSLWARSLTEFLENFRTDLSQHFRRQSHACKCIKKRSPQSQVDSRRITSSASWFVSGGGTGGRWEVAGSSTRIGPGRFVAWKIRASTRALSKNKI